MRVLPRNDFERDGLAGLVEDGAEPRRLPVQEFDHLDAGARAAHLQSERGDEADCDQADEDRPVRRPGGGRSHGNYPLAPTTFGRRSARMATTTKAAPPRMVKIDAIPCTAMPAAATASSEPTPVGVFRAAP